MATKRKLNLIVEHVDQNEHFSEASSPIGRRITRTIKKKVHSYDESFDDAELDLLIGSDELKTGDKLNAAANKTDQVDNSLTSKKFKAMLHFDGLDSDVDNNDDDDPQNDNSIPPIRRNSVESVNSQSDISCHDILITDGEDSDSSIEFIGKFRPPCPVHNNKQPVDSVENKASDIEVKNEKEIQSELKIAGPKRKSIDVSLSNDDTDFEKSNGDLNELDYGPNKPPKLPFKVIKGSRKGKK